MPYAVADDLHAERVLFNTVLPHPYYLNERGFTAEEAIQRMLLKAHMRAAYVFEHGRKTAEELNALDPIEFHERLLREDITYELYAHPRHEWYRDARAERMVVRPEMGVVFANTNDPSVMMQRGSIIRQGLVYYRFLVDEGSGQLTSLMMTRNPSTANYYEEFGIFPFCGVMCDGLFLTSAAVHQESGYIGYNVEKYDPDINDASSAVYDPDALASRGLPVHPDPASDKPLFVEWEGSFHTSIFVSDRWHAEANP